MSFTSLGMTVETLLGMKTNAWLRCQYYEKPDILFSLLYANEPSAFPHLRQFESSPTSESSDLWRTPTFPSHIPLSTEVSLSHRSLSCPLGLLLCFMMSAISSIPQWPSSPSGHSVPDSCFLGLTDPFRPIWSQLSIAFQLS